MRGDSERRQRPQHCAGAHFNGRLHDVADGLCGAGEVGPSASSGKARGGGGGGISGCGRPHRVRNPGRLRRGGELFCRAACSMQVDDVARLRQVGSSRMRIRRALEARLSAISSASACPEESLSGSSTTSAAFKYSECSGFHFFAPPARQVAGKPKPRMRSTFSHLRRCRSCGHRRPL